MIERKIIIALITNTEYLRLIHPIWDSSLLKSSISKELANWVIEYYNVNKKAPVRDIELIFARKVKEGLSEDVAEEIEEDILPSLNEEYEEEQLDTTNLYNETILYFRANKYLQLSEQIDVLLSEKKGDITERLQRVEKIYSSFNDIAPKQDDSIDLSKEESSESIKKAFLDTAEPIMTFPKQLGKFWGEQWVPGSFIAFLAPEKRGKTFLLLHIAIQAARQKKNVAFIQAGDMNEGALLRRIGINLTKRNTLEKYCKEHYQPVRDCIYNQMDECTKKERECDFGVFSGIAKEEIKEFTLSQLIEAYEDVDDYTPCYNCKQYDEHKLGTVWIKKVKEVEQLDYIDADKSITQFFQKNKRRFKISTHPTGVLTVDNIINILDTWENEDNFIPDIIVIDYADLLTAPYEKETRHAQNKVWMGLRKLSQTERKGVLPIVLTATQADGNSYKKHTLTLDNYSEDKRKYAHVTAFYGLNVDVKGREKEIGMLRINELIIREGAFSSSNYVTVLQDLRQGRPVISSFF